jgi:hypothetical protein
MKGEFACGSNGAVSALLNGVRPSFAGELLLVTDHDPNSTPKITDVSESNFSFAKFLQDVFLRQNNLKFHTPA